MPFRAQSGSETVLVVEDEEAVRCLVREMLAESGYTVLEAADGETALSLATSHTEPIDLLLTDVIMPQISGREVAERLLTQLPHLRVLFMSGYMDDAVVRHGILAAEVDFLAKPFSGNALLVKVREVLDK